MYLGVMILWKDLFDISRFKDPMEDSVDVSRFKDPMEESV